MVNHDPDFNVQRSKRGNRRTTDLAEPIRPRMTMIGNCPSHGNVIVWVEGDPDMPKDHETAKIRCIQGTVPSLTPFMTGTCGQLLILRICNPVPTPKEN